MGLIPYKLHLPSASVTTLVPSSMNRRTPGMPKSSASFCNPLPGWPDTLQAKCTLPKTNASSENTPPFTRTRHDASLDCSGPELTRARFTASPEVGAPTPIRRR